MTDAARRAAEDAARRSYGRLVAWLAAQFRDIELAEDAVSDALAVALETWPIKGVPGNPEGWLATVAKRRILDNWRRGDRFEAAMPLLQMLTEERAEQTTGAFHDARLDLMFACAHPAIDCAMHAPLILQTVLGFDAAMIGSAFLVAPATMSQRLVRVKRKIAAAGIPFAVPEPTDLQSRLRSVLDAIYAAFGLAWSDPGSRSARDMSEDAIWLARLVCEAVPEEGEPLGLHSLMLFSHARRAARRNKVGAFVPLEEQDTGLWDGEMAAAAARGLARAVSLGGVGRYRIEAAIQSVHASRAVSSSVNWRSLARLYNDLWQVHPTIGVFVGRAAAQGRAMGAEAGLAQLDELPADRVVAYQPYWATRADLLARTGELELARAAYRTALGLTEDMAVRAFLTARARALTD